MSVEFYNDVNDDSVEYLFCLSSKDSNSYLESLAQLVDLLEDSHFDTVLDTTTEGS